MIDFQLPSASRSEMPDMTPMIDCVFQLLVFFLLASSFVKVSTVFLELPKGAATNMLADEPFVVTMAKNQTLRLNEELIDRERLRDALQPLLESSPSRGVLFRADRTLAYESILDVIVQLEQAGAKQVKLAYEHE